MTTQLQTDDADAIEWLREHAVTVVFNPSRLLLKLPGDRQWTPAETLSDGVRLLNEHQKTPQTKV